MADTISVHRATVGTELVGDPTSRRFVMSLWAVLGSPLKLMPTVADELESNVRESEKRHWRNVLRYDMRHQQGSYTDAEQEAIVNATADAATEWLRYELDPSRGASALKVHRPTLDQDETIESVFKAIPERFFHRGPLRNRINDRQAIAEAVTLGYELLATDNLGSIRREQVNGWLIETQVRPGPLIHEVTSGIARLTGEERLEPKALEAILTAALPDDAQGVERDIRTVNTFLERLMNTPFAEIAEFVDDAWRSRPDIEQAIARTRRGLRHRPRETEARRVQKVRAAAREAGYR